MKNCLLPLCNTKKRLFAGNSSSGSSSILDPDIIEISPPSTWKSNSSKQKSVIAREVIVVDDEDPDDVVVVDEKVASSDKGKKPMLNFLAGHEVITLDGVHSPQANKFVKGNLSPHLSLMDDGFDGSDRLHVISADQYVVEQFDFDSVNVLPRTKAIAPSQKASAANEKHAEPTSKSSLSGTQNYSNVGGSQVDHFKIDSFFKTLEGQSSIFKSASYGSNDHPLSDPATLKSIRKIPYACTPTKSSTSSSPHMTHSNGSAYTKVSQNSSFHGIQNPVVTSSNLPIATPVSNKVRLEDGLSAEITPPSTDRNGNSILEKLELFKKFDTLGDHLGHFYDKTKEAFKPSKGWVNNIADEWRILQKDLPDTIYARVYEARMDLLRAVVMGADGTPYHDGLFFFDVCFTASYPNNPPLVNYHAHGLRINPNLYNSGKVCLSLLGTWSGTGAENWRPGKSNMLQVLLSIQGLVLNADPFFNEPGYVRSRNTGHGHKASKQYSEIAFLLSLKTMLYTMRSPPKYFEDFVFGHFFKHAHDILAACRTYLDGAEVGTYVKGKNQAVQGDNTCSEVLRSNLPSYIKSLVEAFTKIGVEDCEKYLISMDKGPNC